MTPGTAEQMHYFPKEASYDRSQTAFQSKNFSSVNTVLFKYIDDFCFMMWKFETRKLEALMNNCRMCFHGSPTSQQEVNN